MTADPNAARAIFMIALDKTEPAERAAYLAQACGSDDVLRRRVEVLLKANDDPGSFLNSPVNSVATVDEPFTERPGTVIGPYKLLQQIGEGGMGTVFMAEQTEPVRRMVALKLIKEGMDSRQIIARFEAERQALALMDHPNIAKVFEAGTIGPVASGQWPLARVPTQSTGQLATSHSPLATTGRPYFVMELVKGVPITKYCDDHHLTPRQRLELFVPVCQAVQHAHQKGIIHRDLKPSNVLVAQYDGKPAPKIIDFGVAKATGPKLTDMTLFTELGAVVGTFEYMSPEQAELNQFDVDTRSDIYSLGVLLYELLTGTTPLERKRIKLVALLEVLRLIREEESPKPSTRLSTTEGLPSIAANRGVEPKKLSGLMRGELDWILMKALEKDRNRRYETANGLAADVQRYLSDEPVEACPPSASYRLKKFVRRHQGPVAAAGLVLLCLLGGIASASWGLVRARQAEAQEREEANAARQARDAEAAQYDRAQQNLKLALKVLEEIYLQLAQERVPRGPQQQQEERELLKKALDFYKKFAEQNSTDPAVRLESIRANRRVADIERLVGQHVGARQAYADAIVKAETLAKSNPHEPEYTHELAACRNALGELLTETGELDQASEQFGQAIELLGPLLKDGPVLPQFQAELARAHHALGLARKQRGERHAAEEQFQQALDLQVQLAAQNLKREEYRANLAQMHYDAGTWSLQGPGDTAAAGYHERSAAELMKGLVKEFPAVPSYRRRQALCLGPQEAMELQLKLIAEYPSVPDYKADLASSYIFVGIGERNAGAPGPAAEHWRKSIDLAGKLVTDFPNVTRYKRTLALGLIEYAEMLLTSDKDVDQARKCFEQAADYLRPLVKTYPQKRDYSVLLVWSCWELAQTLAALGQHDEAGKRLKEAEDIFAKTVRVLEALPNGFSNVSFFCRDVADGLLDYVYVCEKAGRPQGAAAAYQHLIKIYDTALELDPINNRAFMSQKTELLLRRAAIYVKLGRPLEAEKTYRQVAAIQEKLEKDAAAMPEARWDLAQSYVQAASLLKDIGQPEKREKPYRKAIEIYETLPSETVADPARRTEMSAANNELVNLLKANGRPQEAVTVHRQAIEFYAKLANANRTEPGFRLEQAVTYYRLAELLMNVGQPKDAENAYRSALDLSQKIVAEVPAHRYHLANVYRLLAILLNNSGRDQEAAECHRKAKDIFEQLTREPPDRESQRDSRFMLAVTNSELGSILATHNQSQECEQLWHKAIDSFEKLIVELPDKFDYRWWLNFSHKGLADHLKATSRPLEAEKVYREAIGLLEKLSAAHMTEPGFRETLADIWGNFANFLRDIGKLEEGEKTGHKAIETYEKLVTEFPDRANYPSNLAGLIHNMPVHNESLAAERQRYERAIRYQEAAIKLSPENQGLQGHLGNHYLALARTLIKSGEHPRAKEAYGKAIGIKELLASKPPPPDGNARWDLGQAYRELAEQLATNLKSPKEAEDRYRQALALQEKLAADFPKVPEYRWLLAITHRELAIVLTDNLNRTKEAEEHYQKSLAIFEKLAADFPNMWQYLEQAGHSHRYLGGLFTSTGRPARAETAWQNAVAILKGVSATSALPVQRNNLADTYRQLGNALRDTQKLAQAEKAYRQALALQEKLAADFPKVPEYRLQLAHSHNSLGHILWNDRQTQAGEKECREALELFIKLAAEFPTNVEYRTHVPNCYSQLGGFFAGNNQPSEAGQAYRLAIDASEKLVADFLTVVQPRWDLTTCYINVARFLHASNQDSEAEKVYDRASKFFEARQALFPEQTEYRHELGRIYNHLGLLLASIGRGPEAEKAHRQALDLYEKLAQANLPAEPERWRRQELMWTQENLGRFLTNHGQAQEAEKAYRQAIALSEQLNRDFPNQGYTGWMAKEYGNFGMLLSATGRPDEAAKAYSKILDLEPQSAVGHNNLAWLLATCPDLKFRDPKRAIEFAKKAAELAPQEGNNWNTLGVAHYRAGGCKAALAALEKSNDLLKGNQLSFNAFFLAMAHWQLGDKGEARRWYDQAVQWMDKNAPKNEELVRFRAEAEELLGVRDKK